jgi:predicted NUDIX family NTP pyrophosphohydrolase
VPSRSAGILLYRLRDGEPELLLVHPGGPLWSKRDAGAWSIPKGEYDEDEEPEACARRELAEELGSMPELGELLDLGTVRLKSRKIVHGWAARGDFDPATLNSNTFEMDWPPRTGHREVFPEVDRAEWLSPADAREKINPAQAAFIDRLLEQL